MHLSSMSHLFVLIVGELECVGRPSWTLFNELISQIPNTLTSEELLQCLATIYLEVWKSIYDCSEWFSMSRYC
jgi:hypothetical protein